MEHFTFRRAEEHEVDEVFELIMARVRWMDEKGITQMKSLSSYEEFN